MWLIPTRRRVSKLREFCNSAVKAETTTPALIIIDAKDYKDNQHDYMNLEMYHFPTGAGWKIHVSEAEGMGPKIREVWPQIQDRAWVGVLNDDHVIVTKHWDKRLVNQLTGRNFITCNDKWQAPNRAAGATVFSMPLLEAFGFPMFPPQIDHLGIDDVFETIGRNTGCWEVDMSVTVEHHHAFKSPETGMDETHRKVYGTSPWQNPQTGELNPEAKSSREALAEWLKTDAPGVIERVRKLRSREGIQELPSGKPRVEATAIPVSEARG